MRIHAPHTSHERQLGLSRMYAKRSGRLRSTTSSTRVSEQEGQADGRGDRRAQRSPPGRAGQRGDQQRAGRDGLRPQVGGDAPAPRPHRVRHVVDGTAQRAVAAGAAVLDRGHHAHQVGLVRRALGPEIRRAPGAAAAASAPRSRRRRRRPSDACPARPCAPRRSRAPTSRAISVRGSSRSPAMIACSGQTITHAGSRPDLDPVRAVVALGGGVAWPDRCRARRTGRPACTTCSRCSAGCRSRRCRRGRR